MSEKKKISKGKILSIASMGLGIISWLVSSMKEEEDQKQMIEEIKEQVKEEIKKEEMDQCKEAK